MLYYYKMAHVFNHYFTSDYIVIQLLESYGRLLESFTENTRRRITERISSTAGMGKICPEEKQANPQ